MSEVEGKKGTWSLSFLYSMSSEICVCVCQILLWIRFLFTLTDLMLMDKARFQKWGFEGVAVLKS